MHSHKFRALAVASLLSSASLGAQAHAQTLPPIRAAVDERGVDLASGSVQISDAQLSIGGTSNGLRFTRRYMGPGYWRHNFKIAAFIDATNHVIISDGDETTGFTLTGGVYISDQGTGAQLTENASSYTYTNKDGTQIYLDKTLVAGTTVYDLYGLTNNSAVATLITRPTGEKVRLYYRRDGFVYSPGTTFYHLRLQSVTNSTGFQLKFSYGTNSALTFLNQGDWDGIVSVSAINNAIDYCDPIADTCSGLTQTWPSLTYASSSTNPPTGAIFTDLVTDAQGRVTRYTSGTTSLLGIRRPSSSSDNVTYSYDANGRVSSVAIANVGTWTYNFSLTGTTLSASISTPTVATPRYTSADTNLRQILSETDENGHATAYEYYSNGLLKKITAAEGNTSFYNYDARGNVTSTVITAKSGGATLTTSATYPSSCTNTATCNYPTTSTDTTGKVTNYYYNANGTLDYVQAPAPTAGAARPEVHYSYTTAQAWVKNASGSVVQSPDVITLPTGTTTCVSGSWPCSTASQAVTVTGYFNGPSATNLLVASTTLKSGSGTPSGTTTYAYDKIGNMVSVTDPVGNATTMDYALDRQLTMVRSPSIDGSPTSRRRAAIFHYNSDGLVDSRSFGSSNPDGSSFSAMRVGLVGYDSAGRKISDSVTNGAGSTTYTVTQYSYDGAGRVGCVAQRMNPSIFGSLPSSACTLGTAGSFGSDRITHFVWDNAGLLNKMQMGYNTALAQDNVTYSRSANDRVSTLTDAKGNVTSYVYDGFDRPLKTCFNASLSACQGGTATDYVQLTYDSVGRLTGRSVRGQPGSVIGYSYDDLLRLKHIDYPGSGAFDQDIDYTYDNLGRPLSSVDAAGHSATFAYDAIGNVTSQGDAISSRTMQYDAAGKRIRLTWPDGRYVTYGYNGASQMSSILENGSSTLATFAYDDLGRRTSLTRGNGTATTYSYDAVHLSGLTNDLAGTTYDQTFGFSYNPADQITQRTSSNDAYAWTQHYNVNRNYSSNALNQYTASGSITPTYDGKGNLTSAGSPVYSYSTKNELVQRTDTGAQFYPDPLGRLDSIIFPSGSGATYFQYDGSQISNELSSASSSAIMRRYVYGPNDDEPIVWYDGADFSNKRYLMSDERGSVTAVADSAGNMTAINSYDPHGIPNFTNLGRFQYTGQAWIPELGMYSFKARIYSPTLGRFLQTDPAGYGDGPNWYNYAGGDPINHRDPSGLDTELPTAGYDQTVTAGFDFGGGLSSIGFGGDLGNIGSLPTVNVGNFSFSGQLALNGFQNRSAVAPASKVTRTGGDDRGSDGESEIEVTARREAAYLLNAVIAALEQACNCEVDRSNFEALSPNFVKVLDRDKLPNIFKGSLSSHAKAYSASIPNSEFILKLYINDNMKTMTITTPLTSPSHYIDFIFSYSLGDPINSYYARQYCLGSGSC